MLFDLDGFKAYNDTFGHPAGDALLSRLGHALHTAVEERARAYRMGGDEFCVLGGLVMDADPLAITAAAALSTQGEGFSVTASYGSVVLPVDASDAGGGAPQGRRAALCQQGHRPCLGGTAGHRRAAEGPVRAQRGPGQRTCAT